MELSADYGSKTSGARNAMQLLSTAMDHDILYAERIDEPASDRTQAKGRKERKRAVNVCARPWWHFYPSNNGEAWDASGCTPEDVVKPSIGATFCYTQKKKKKAPM
jgi:hypothetical protein